MITERNLNSPEEKKLVLDILKCTEDSGNKSLNIQTLYFDNSES